MAKLNVFMFPVVALLVLVAPSLAARESQLAVQVELQKTVMVLGEPIIVSTIVHNLGSEPVEIYHQNAPTYELYPRCVVEARFGPDIAHMVGWSDGLRKVRKTGPKLLPQGESITMDLVILFNRQEGFFAATQGKYWI
ncbi:MAG: hypothetical protein AABZ47_01900 [Planctomycetota bacterium]